MNRDKDDARSAGDTLVQFLSFFPEFTIVGRDPNGITIGVYTGFSRHFLGTGDYVITTIPTVAIYFAGKGPPHHMSRRTGVVDDQVWYTREDITNGEDTVLDYAFQLVREAGSEGE